MAEVASPPPITYNVADLTADDFFGYNPSLSLAATALALYFVAAVIVGIQVVTAKNKNGGYMHLVTLTGLTEAAGYAALVYLIQKSGQTNIYGAYVAMQVFVILSPNLLQAADYSTVGKIIAFSNLPDYHSWLKPKLITIGFITADILALCIQAIGISLWASSKGSGKPDEKIISIGSWVTVAGLGVQVISFAIFMFLAVWVQRHPRNKLRGQRSHMFIFVGMHLSFVFLNIRNVFRFVEFVQGAILTWPFGEDTFVISENEVLFYALDTLPILLCFVAFILFNPARLLPKESVADQAEVEYTAEGIKSGTASTSEGAELNNNYKAV